MSQHTLVQTILEKYEFADATYELLADQWNTTYRITTPTGQRYNLRICGAAFQDKKCLEDELNFVDFVAKSQQVRVPRPARNLQGALVTLIETPEGTRLSCIFEWIEGEAARGQLTVPLMHHLGRMVAHLHLVIKTFPFPSKEDSFRTGYNFDEVLVASHRIWIEEYAEEIGSERIKLLNTAIDHTLERFRRDRQNATNLRLYSR